MPGRAMPGLACPDWPLCYGSLLPGRQMNVQVFLEWFHRLDAFVVGVALLMMTLASFLWRRQLPGWLPGLSAILVVLVASQGVLGALTVLQLLPSGVVMAHLGMALTLLVLLPSPFVLSGVGVSLALLALVPSLAFLAPNARLHCMRCFLCCALPRPYCVVCLLCSLSICLTPGSCSR